MIRIVVALLLHAHALALDHRGDAIEEALPVLVLPLALEIGAAVGTGVVVVVAMMIALVILTADGIDHLLDLGLHAETVVVTSAMAADPLNNEEQVDIHAPAHVQAHEDARAAVAVDDTVAVAVGVAHERSHFRWKSS